MWAKPKKEQDAGWGFQGPGQDTRQTQTSFEYMEERIHKLSKYQNLI